MHKKVAIVRLSAKHNEKEIVDIVHESIYDIQKKHNNVYTMQRLIELERLVLGDDTISYQLKLIDDEELQSIMFNRELNNKPKLMGSATLFIFLITQARMLDQYCNNDTSRIILSNYDFDKLNLWIKKTIGKLKEDKSNKLQNKILWLKTR